MYELTVIAGFAAAHNLRDYDGECERIHGHNWRVTAIVAAEKLDKIGLVLDFKVIKKGLTDILNTLDHRHLNDVEPFNIENPSSENIARYVFEELERFVDGLGEKVAGQGVHVKNVMVWESDNAGATYYKEEKV